MFIHCDGTFAKKNKPDDAPAPIFISVMSSTGFAYAGAGDFKVVIRDRDLVNDVVVWFLICVQSSD
eukprot:12392949-Heterocapsa_arctica.AAC.1